eukprot:gene12005-8572_t
MSFFAGLVGLDAFPKANDEYRLKTNTGAIVSIVSMAIMIFLLFGEVRFFFQKETVETLFVNTTRANSISMITDSPSRMPFMKYTSISCRLMALALAEAKDSC